MIDSGATINIIHQNTYDNMRARPTLHKSSSHVYAYGSKQPMTVVGQFEAVIESKTKYASETFHVVPGDSGSLLSYETARKLGLIHIVHRVSDTPTTQNSRVSDIAARFPGLCDGIGKLKGTTVKLHIDENVKPVAQTRRTPFHLRDKVDAEITKLLNEDIIEKVEGEPTP